jgi:hypothetical protein
MVELGYEIFIVKLMCIFVSIPFYISPSGNPLSWRCKKSRKAVLSFLEPLTECSQLSLMDLQSELHHFIALLEPFSAYKETSWTTTCELLLNLVRLLVGEQDQSSSHTGSSSQSEDMTELEDLVEQVIFIFDDIING